MILVRSQVESHRLLTVLLQELCQLAEKALGNLTLEAEGLLWVSIEDGVLKVNDR